MIAMMVPIMIKKMTFLKKWTWFYAVAGMGLLAVVLVFGDRVNGAKININIGSFAFQPSEFVKIIFVFFVASRLYKKSAGFKCHVMTSAAVAAAYVLILVLSRDLGACGILHHLCHYAVCGNQESLLSVCRSWKRLWGCSDCLFLVWTCATTCSGMENPLFCISE